MVEITIDRDNEIIRTALKGNGTKVAEEVLVAAGTLLNTLSTVTGDDKKARDILIGAIESEELLKNLRDVMEEEQWQA